MYAPIQIAFAGVRRSLGKIKNVPHVPFGLGRIQRIWILLVVEVRELHPVSRRGHWLYFG